VKFGYIATYNLAEKPSRCWWAAWRSGSRL